MSYTPYNKYQNSNNNLTQKRKTVMLATFTNDSIIDTVLYTIFGNYILDKNTIFIFSDADDTNNKILTYNISTEDPSYNNVKDLKRTIRINRKKESNTLYTINAVNRIIELEGGEKNRDRLIDWSKYRNMILLYDENDNSIVQTNTKLYYILKKEEFYNKKTGLVKTNPQYV